MGPPVSVANDNRTLFDGMLSSFPNPHMTSGNPIPLDFQSKLIGIFLDCASSSAPVGLSITEKDSIRTLVGLNALAKYLDCGRLLPHINSMLVFAGKLNPLLWLLAADEFDDLDQAVKALRAWAETGAKMTTVEQISFVSQVNWAWRHALLVSFYRTAEWPVASHDYLGRAQDTWAEDFRTMAQQYKREVVSKLEAHWT